MRIAVIGAKGLPPRQGGIEHYCAEVFPRVVEKGHSVDLFAQSTYTGFPWFNRHEFRGVNVRTLPSFGVNGIDTLVSSAVASLLTVRPVYDVVHFHALGPGLFSLLPRLATESKIVVTCHGLDWQREKWGKLSGRLIRLGEKASVRFAHEITVVSADLQNYFAKTYGRSTTFIPNAPAGYAASDPDFPFVRSLGAEPGKYIIFLGRLVPEKCPDLLIEAFQSIQAKDWKLILVGGHAAADLFTAKLYRLAATNRNIIFAGELRGARLAEVMRGAGAFTLPSNLEGSPLALLEAMRENIPVIASDIKPHQELLQTDKGLLFKKGDPIALRDCLNWALCHPHQMQMMAEKAKKEILLNYNWNRVSTETIRLYESLCEWGEHPTLEKTSILRLDQKIKILSDPRE
ncbi:glycosyltransferase family 4 protein [Altericista sp. CCNU0014]|uniref:glycosyltransferase family 4 protein n=1 Tax=Altericista sp. CCNU0014 TaxID=3082949 RepID=UPI00384AC675